MTLPWRVIPNTDHRAPKRGFYYPGGNAPRTAVLVPWFRQGWLQQGRLRRALFGIGESGDRMEMPRGDSPIKIFDRGWCAEAALFQPGAIAGTKEQLLKLAAKVDRPVLTHAVICLGQQTDLLLTPDECDRLWRVFEVPVFEQIIGPQGELLASDCEAHDGLHIQVAEFTLDIETNDSPGRNFMIETSPCACGRRTPRLIAQASYAQAPLAKAAAAAR